MTAVDICSAQPTCDGVNLPHGHSLTDMVDGGFSRIDTSPADGRITTDEFDSIIQYDDTNSKSIGYIQTYR